MDNMCEWYTELSQLIIYIPRRFKPLTSDYTFSCDPPAVQWRESLDHLVVDIDNVLVVH
jgi:hypothetical protein